MPNPPRITWNTVELTDFVKAQVSEGLKNVANNVQVTMRKKVRRKKFPPASKPGEPPAMRTGKLHDAIVFERGEDEFSWEIGLTKRGFYGRFLELGTAFIRRRPFMLDSLKEVISRFDAGKVFRRRVPTGRRGGRTRRGRK